VEWQVKPVSVGTAADTPHTLRMKAKEFLRMAGEARDPHAYEGLKKLADDYMARAMDIESGATTPAASNENTAHETERTG
jgi:hypothetical protein